MVQRLWWLCGEVDWRRQWEEMLGQRIVSCGRTGGRLDEGWLDEQCGGGGCAQRERGRGRYGRGRAGW